MIDHISLRVSDFQKSLSFYKAALDPLGYTLVFSDDQEQYAGFAGPDRERIWIGHREGASHGYTHIAVLAKDRATVRKFYEAAMKAGGRDNGGAGPRPNYSPTYYGAFVLDPDGHNIEAVCFAKGE
ncbi:MAG TPA: VOC family protein [Candidatus Binatus sp.]|uniref:VOC family protein n=1 Tax=Candidatus Binatus sp. TaxID=2811406 RepID=UPI002F3F946B